MFSVFEEGSLIFGAISFNENPLTMLHVVCELPTVSLTVFIEVLSSSVLLVLEPVPNIQFTANVVVLTLSVLHSIEEFTLVTLTVIVGERTDTFQLAIDDASFISHDVPV